MVTETQNIFEFLNKMFSNGIFKFKDKLGGYFLTISPELPVKKCRFTNILSKITYSIIL